MYKTVAFTVCSLLITIGVVCWVFGLLPAAQATSVSRPARPAKVTAPSTPPMTSDNGISVYFSPHGGCTEAIVREVGDATQCVYVQAAQFTSAPIAKALVAAKRRGLDVKVIIDSRKDSEKGEADRLTDGGVPTFADGQHHTAHNKVVLIDHRLIFTGSFNLTRESEAENAENLLLIQDKPKLMAAYEANFAEHLAHSAPYQN